MSKYYRATEGDEKGDVYFVPGKYLVPVEVDDMPEVKALKELREGDNKLIRALAENAGIQITAPDHMLGSQWEQFYEGVMRLTREHMTEKRARRIISAMSDADDPPAIHPDNSLLCLSLYSAWNPGEEEICLDSRFTAEQLEALAWWMRNKSIPSSDSKLESQTDSDESVS